MKENIIELIIIFALNYLIFSFIAASVNPADWGVILRSLFIIISFAVFGINKKYS